MDNETAMSAGMEDMHREIARLTAEVAERDRQLADLRTAVRICCHGFPSVWGRLLVDMDKQHADALRAAMNEEAKR